MLKKEISQMQMDDDKVELLFEHLRHIRGDLGIVKAELATLKSDILNARKDIHKISGELLRQEESIAGLAVQVDRINTRLGLNDTPQ
jgi:predicted  nucleic acid-binding Zn-ribbon protein